MAAAAPDRTIDLRAALTGGLRRFKTLAKDVARHPSADGVHDLRVVTRRLRADLWLIPGRRRTAAIRRTRRELRRLADVLGNQRKYDVANADADRFGSPTGNIEKRLRAARRDVIRALRRKRRRRYERHLERAIDDTATLGAGVLSGRIVRLGQQLERSLRHPPKTNAARHRLRINVKKARYLLEAGRQPIGQLRHLQDHLGRWHDLTVLIDVVGPKRSVTIARDREWQLAERRLRPALVYATERLSALSTATTVQHARH